MIGELKTEGRRVHNIPPYLYRPGDYGRYDLDGEWYGMTPGGMLAWLVNHRVIENEDGTITVSPSILTRGGATNGEWHGYLERGVWREC